MNINKNLFVVGGRLLKKGLGPSLSSEKNVQAPLPQSSEILPPSHTKYPILNIIRFDSDNSGLKGLHITSIHV